MSTWKSTLDMYTGLHLACGIAGFSQFEKKSRSFRKKGAGFIPHFEKVSRTFSNLVPDFKKEMCYFSFQKYVIF